jgi:hypothetical protein
LGTKNKIQKQFEVNFRNSTVQVFFKGPNGK